MAAFLLGVRAIVNRLIDPRPAYANSSGVPYSGGVLSFFASGTSTPLNVYSGSDLTGGSTTITLNSAGRPSQDIFLANVLYKMTLADVLGNPIFTADPVFTSDYSATAKVQGYSGNPNGFVAGTASAGAIPADAVWDRTNRVLYLCTTTGVAAAAVWTVANVTALSNWTTAGRNVSPTAGVDFGYNTTLNGLEFWNAAKWITLGQTPTVQTKLSGTAATYTATTTGVVRQRVRILGPSGGGAGATANNGVAGSADTSFQVNATGTAWTAVKGSGGVANSGAGGAGGTGGSDGSTGTLIARFSGSTGQPGQTCATASVDVSGGIGGSSPFGGAGPGTKGGAGGAAKTNSGSGGGGGGATTGNTGGGGGSGEYVEFWVTGMSTATYTVGLGGAGGAAGTNAGGNGAAGIIIIEEFYS